MWVGKHGHKIERVQAVFGVILPGQRHAPFPDRSSLITNGGLEFRLADFSIVHQFAQDALGCAHVVELLLVEHLGDAQPLVEGQRHLERVNE